MPAIAGLLECEMVAATTAAIVDVLGGPQVMGEVRSLFDLAESLERGLPYAALEAAQAALGVSREELARVVRLPARTAARRKQQHSLSPEESDRLYRVASVLARACQTFDTPEIAARWLKRPNRGLAGKVPFDLLATEAGAQLVDDVLGRIDHGIIG